MDPITEYILEQNSPITMRLEKEIRKAFPIAKIGMTDSKCKQIKKLFADVNKRMNNSPERGGHFKGSRSPAYKALAKKQRQLNPLYDKCFKAGLDNKVKNMKRWYLSKGPSVCQKISKNKKELKQCLNHCKSRASSMK